MEPDEISALKLDEEFKNTLALIRPHVLSINSVYGMIHFPSGIYDRHIEDRSKFFLGFISFHFVTGFYSTTSTSTILLYMIWYTSILMVLLSLMIRFVSCNPSPGNLPDSSRRKYFCIISEPDSSDGKVFVYGLLGLSAIFLNDFLPSQNTSVQI